MACDLPGPIMTAMLLVGRGCRFAVENQVIMGGVIRVGGFFSFLLILARHLETSLAASHHDGSSVLKKLANTDCIGALSLFCCRCCYLCKSQHVICFPIHDRYLSLVEGLSPHHEDVFFLQT